MYIITEPSCTFPVTCFVKKELWVAQSKFIYQWSRVAQSKFVYQWSGFKHKNCFLETNKTLLSMFAGCTSWTAWWSMQLYLLYIPPFSEHHRKILHTAIVFVSLSIIRIKKWWKMAKNIFILLLYFLFYEFMGEFCLLQFHVFLCIFHSATHWMTFSTEKTVLFLVWRDN